MCSREYLLFASVLTVTCNYVLCALSLRGVTLASLPFVNKTSENPLKLEGYAVDLVNEISRIAGFEYTLYVTPDNQYGALDMYGNPKGMIEELSKKRADFAIADLTVGPVREQFVDFTVPFMTLDLSALISKRNVGNMSSFEDLLNNPNITFGILRSGATEQFMTKSNDPILMRMNNMINTFRFKYHSVYQRSEGIDRALNSNYAFIQESVANEYAADQNCNLTVINSPDENYPRSYAIALQHNSEHLDKFNAAIRQLQTDGTLDRLWHKYWRTNCLSGADSFTMNSRRTQFFISTFGLLMSAIITVILFS